MVAVVLRVLTRGRLSADQHDHGRVPCRFRPIVASTSTTGTLGAFMTGS